MNFPFGWMRKPRGCFSTGVLERNVNLPVAASEYTNILQLEQNKFCSIVQRFGPDVVSDHSVASLLSFVETARSQGLHAKFDAVVRKLQEKRRLKSNLIEKAIGAQAVASQQEAS